MKPSDLPFLASYCSRLNQAGSISNAITLSRGELATKIRIYLSYFIFIDSNSALFSPWSDEEDNPFPEKKHFYKEKIEPAWLLDLVGEKKVLRIPNPWKDSRLHCLLTERETGQDLILVMVSLAHQHKGVMIVTCEKDHPFQPDDCQQTLLLEGIANLLASAIYRLYWEREFQKNSEVIEKDNCRFQLATHLTNIGAWEWNLKTGEVYWSEGFKKQLGYQPGEIEASYGHWCTLIHPDYLASELKKCMDCRDDKVSDYESDYRMRHRDGSYRWMMSRATLIRDKKGLPLSMVGWQFDITERKQTELALKDREARLRAIYTTAPDAILTTDREGIISSANIQALALFELAESDLVGQSFTNLLDPTSAQLYQILAVGLRSEDRKQSSPAEVKILSGSGSQFWAELSACWVEPPGLFTIILNDVSTRKRLEKEIDEIAGRERQRIGQDLHDTVSQELFALNILTGDLREIICKGDQEKAVRLLDSVETGLQRSFQNLRFLMQGLLPVVVNADEFMVALIDLAIRVKSYFKKICKIESPDLVQIENNLIATQLFLIIQEAVYNSCRHSGADSIRICLIGNPLLEISVEDEGDTCQPKPGKGSGLGLKIMQNRAYAIGATLKVEDITPSGKRVRCILKSANEVVY